MADTSEMLRETDLPLARATAALTRPAVPTGLSAVLAASLLGVPACGAPQSQRTTEVLAPEAFVAAASQPEVVDDDAVAEADADAEDLRYAPGRPLTIDVRMAQRCRQHRPVVEQAARQAGLDPNLLLAIAWVESGFNAQAESPAGAVGLMQMVPRTAQAFGCGDPLAPRCAATAAAAYFNLLLKRFDGQVVYALCAYHSGAAQPTRAYRARRLPTNLSYAERVLEAKARLDRHGCDGR